MFIIILSQSLYFSINHRVKLFNKHLDIIGKIHNFVEREVNSIVHLEHINIILLM